MKKYRILWALTLVIALIGCNRKQNSNDEHAHDESLQLTGYSNDFEVFTEVKPFVVGQASDILAHFSFLSNFKPLEEGNVIVSLIVGSKGVRQTLEKPTKKGIYQFSLKPEVAGTGEIIFDIKRIEGTSQIIIPNIHVYTDKHEAEHAAAKAAATSSNGVAFTKEQSWKVDFATEVVTKIPFGQVIKTTAQILPSQGDERVITSKSNGIVLFPNGNIIDGQAVKAGQPIFTIESSNLADNNMNVRYAEATNEYNRAKTEYDRKKELAKDKIVSESDLLKAKTEFSNAEATYNNLRANFFSGKQIISSPINGFVRQVFAKSGEYVEAGHPVLVVSQNIDLLIKAELQPKYLSLLGLITSANFKELNNNHTYTLEELKGKVVSYGKTTDPQNPLIPVIFQVKNSVDLLPGSFVEMYIKTVSENHAITVPNEAIVEEMGNYFVYVQLTPEFFEKRPVTMGSTDGFRTEITEGLTNNERIVSKGAILVKLAQASGALDAHSGHVH